MVAHASETVNVVDTCVATELLRSMLPHLLEQLELTQKSLSAYLGALCCAALSLRGEAGGCCNILRALHAS